MKKINYFNYEEMVSKKAVFLSILAISIICTTLASMTATVHANHAGYAMWYNPDTGDWEVVPPSPNHLDLLPEDLPIKLKICGLSDFIGKVIQIKVANEDWFISPDRVQLLTGPCTGEFWWPDSEHPFDYTICETNVIQFRVLTPNDTGNQNNGVYIASGIFGGDENPAHIHVIPEFAFGTAMSIISLLSGLMAYSKFRRN